MQILLLMRMKASIAAYACHMTSFLPGFLSVVLIDLVLSGDNALVIGMACAGLPPRQRRMGILYGSLAAILMRVVLAAGTAYLLRVPLLQAMGGLLLLWIAFRLAGNTGGDHGEVRQGATVWDAVKTIAMADVVMSLDNVLAVGGVSRGNVTLLLIGLGLTIPIIMWGSGLVATLLDRAPWLSYAGAGVLVWSGAKMIMEDPTLGLPANPLFPVAATAVVLGLARLNRRRTA